MLVEDHAETAEVMRQLLEKSGFAVLTAGNYQDALTIASRGQPDVLVCDLGLPGKDGLELMKTMRQTHPGLLGIVVSGSTGDEEQVRSREVGFSEYLAKPISVNQLIEAIHRQLSLRETGVCVEGTSPPASSAGPTGDLRNRP